MPHSTSARILLAVLAALAACIAPKTALMNGEPAPANQAEAAARSEYATLRASLAALPPLEAARREEAFATRYRGTSSAADALFAAGSNYRKAGKHERASQTLGTLLTEYPLYPRSVEAKYLLALANIESGHARDGLQTLSTVYGKLPDPLKKEAASRAADAALSLGSDGEALKWLSDLVETTQGDVQKDAQSRAATVIDRLPFLDVAKSRESFPKDALIQEPLAMKLARVELHLGDLPRAEELAKEVTTRWPNGLYAEGAKALVDHIAKLTFVRPNVIGVAVPLSGPSQRFGEMILSGVGLALGEGSPVRLAVRDTRGEPEGAAQAIESLVTEEGAIMILGGVTTAESERAAATAEELRVPFVSLSRQDGVTDAGDYVFQNMLTASAQAKALVDLMMGKRGMKRFGLMWPAVPYGIELANDFWDEVEARGGEVRAAETYAPDRTTFTPLVEDMVGKLYLDERADWKEQVKEIGETETDPFRRHKAIQKAREHLEPIVDFDAIFIPDGASNVKLIAPALAVEDIITQTCEPDEVARIAKTTGRPDLKPVQLLGSNAWGFDPSLFDTSASGAGRHVRCAIYVDGFFAGSDRPETKKFVEAFEKKYPGQVPTILEADANDAALMALRLLGPVVTTRSAFRDALASLKNVKGATGDITVGPKRTFDKDLFFLTLDRNGLHEMTPDELHTPGL